MSGTAGRATLAVECARVPGGRRRLEHTLARLAEYAAARAGGQVELSFTLVDDPRMGEIHEAYAGVEGPTDVLSFPLLEEPRLVGEIVISAETARREAAERGHPAYDEIVLYAVHGTLHLLGYDDHDGRERRRMRSAERRALAALGLPPVYGGQRKARRRRSGS